MDVYRNHNILLQKIVMTANNELTDHCHLVDKTAGLLLKMFLRNSLELWQQLLLIKRVVSGQDF